MQYSGILPLTTGAQEVAACNIGQEVILFGLVFVNSTAAVRTITMTVYRQADASTQTLPFEVAAKEKYSWPKPITLQPGDTVDLQADAAGVKALFSIDEDAGVNPVATGFTIRGTYSNVTPYDPNDIVFYDGGSYVAIRATTNDQPDVSPADWMLLLDGSDVSTAIADLVDGAPATLDTLNKLAAAIQDNPTFGDDIVADLALKADTSALATVALSGAMVDLTDYNNLAIRRLFSHRELL